MILNIDCVRSVMIELESFPIGYYTVTSFRESAQEYGDDNVLYSLVKLTEAGYINSKYMRTLDGRPHIESVYDLTFSGHEFLEKIKSDGIWNNNIKPVLSAVGSKSFEAIVQVASNVISTLISKQLGTTV